MQSIHIHECKQFELELQSKEEIEETGRIYYRKRIRLYTKQGKIEITLYNDKPITEMG